MNSEYYGYEFDKYISTGETLLNVNGYVIRKPARFKNLAHERAFEIALVLSRKKPMWSGITIMTTSECIEILMYHGISEIQLKEDAVNPNVVAHRAMELVPSLFERGIVEVKKRKHGNRMWFLEIRPESSSPGNT